MERVPDRFQHAVAIRIEMSARDAEDSESGRFQDLGALFVEGKLLGLAMLGPVKLDDEFGAVANEIDDKVAQRRLSAYLVSRETAIAQGLQPPDTGGH